MPQIGPLEILVVGVLALLVFGPEKLPEMARSLGKGLTQLKRMASDAKSEFDMGLDAADEETPATAPAAKAAEVVEPAETAATIGPAATSASVTGR
jgi:Tat protein translocase TatB subunit